ncbi:MAG TPA: Hsp20/alpha crystallin family protein [Kiritimatiellia bacterium]|nr:Hsp20/alpha crystallin family protein [Kiritimatiellia bacterium]
MTDKNQAIEKASSGAVREAARRPVYEPRVDIYEKKDALLVVMDTPGVEDKDIDIQLEQDVLTITAEQHVESMEGFTLMVRGAVPGVFKRSFTLNRDIDRERIEANLRNGVLHLVLPKTEKAQPRRIDVKAA